MKKHTLIIPYLLFMPLLSVASASDSVEIRQQQRQPASEAVYWRWHNAIGQGDLGEARRLLNQYPIIDINTPDPQDPRALTPLMIAFMGGNDRLFRFLLDNEDVDLTVRDRRGRTIVHIIVEKNDLRTLQELRDRLTPELLNLRDNNRYTAVDWATRNNYLEIANFLITLGGRNTQIFSPLSVRSANLQPIRFDDGRSERPQPTQPPQQFGSRLAQVGLVVGCIILAHLDWRLGAAASVVSIAAYLAGYSNFLSVVF